MRKAVVAMMFLVAIAAGGCGVSTASQSSSSSTSSTLPTSTTKAPLPAGATPSYIARQVCANTAQSDIDRVLGVNAQVSSPTWVGHLYTCNYVYPNGSFAMSVKELSSWPATFAYYRSLGTRYGDTGSLGNLGQGAFTTTDGSVVVRKDWKVLLVDIARLPAQFGNPATSRADVAFTIADIILGCWAGD